MQTVLITGGSRGIGAEMVRLFCRKGWQKEYFSNAFCIW